MSSVVLFKSNVLLYTNRGFTNHGSKIKRDSIMGIMNVKIFEFGIWSDYLSPLSFMHVKNSNFGAKKPLLVKILYEK